MITQLGYNILISAATYCLAAMAFYLVMATSRYFHFTVALPFVVVPYIFLSHVAGGRKWRRSDPCGARWHCHFRRRRRGHGMAFLPVVATTRGNGPPTRYRVTSRVVRRANALRSLGLRPGSTLSVSSFSRFGQCRMAGVVVNYHQILAFLAAALVLGLLGFLWWGSPLGLIFRGLQENEITCQTKGIPIHLWRCYAVAIAFGVAAAAGAAYSVDSQVTPEMGFDIAFVGMACVIIGGTAKLWQPLLWGRDRLQREECRFVFLKRQLGTIDYIRSVPVLCSSAHNGSERRLWS